MKKNQTPLSGMLNELRQIDTLPNQLVKLANAVFYLAADGHLADSNAVLSLVNLIGAAHKEEEEQEKKKKHLTVNK